MNLRVIFCHFVVSFVTFFVANSQANGAKSCQSLFDKVAVSLETRLTRDQLTVSQKTVELLKAGLLAELRTVNTAKDHVPFFENQLPIVLERLFVGVQDTIQVLGKPVHNKAVERQTRAPKNTLEKKLLESYELLKNEATQKISEKAVTYEWYMDFFLRAIALVDVTVRALNQNHSHEQIEILTRRTAVVSGKSKTLYSTDVREVKLFSSMSLQYSILMKNSYFRGYLPEHIVVPVLFVPKASDIIEAEKMGLHFITFTAARQNTLEGKKFPMEFAGYQQEKNLERIHLFKDFINPQTKWLKFHNKISSRITGDAALEAMYVYVLRDANLQLELTKRFEVKRKPILISGHRIAFLNKNVNHHEAHDYLQEFFNRNSATVETIGSHTTVNAFLKVIYQIEKEALDSSH